MSTEKKYERVPLLGGTSGYQSSAYSTTSTTKETTLSIDSRSAREAYKRKDVTRSIYIHDKRSKEPAKEIHQTDQGGYIKPAVFGGLDGLMTTFAVVTSVEGASLAPAMVLVLGFANVFSDGLSMGFGEWVSGSAEADFEKAEYKREKWEMQANPAGEVQEMIDIYVQKGFTREEATDIITIMSKHQDFFVDHMFVQELGMMPPDEEDSPAKEGLVMFLSFVLFGTISLIPYIVLIKTSFEDGFDPRFLISTLLTAVALFVLGVVKAKYSLESWWASGLRILSIGIVANAAAYGIGYGIEKLVGANNNC